MVHCRNSASWVSTLRAEAQARECQNLQQKDENVPQGIQNVRLINPRIFLLCLEVSTSKTCLPTFSCGPEPCGNVIITCNGTNIIISVPIGQLELMGLKQDRCCNCWIVLSDCLGDEVGPSFLRNFEKPVSLLKKREVNLSRNASHNCFWDSYWKRAVISVPNNSPIILCKS